MQAITVSGRLSPINGESCTWRQEVRFLGWKVGSFAKLWKLQAMVSSDTWNDMTTYGVHGKQTELINF
jgi:hypothetical protein